jgi:hypothetical protein
MSRFAHIPPSKFFLEIRTKYRDCYNPIFIRTVLFRSLLMILSTVLYGCPFNLPVHKPSGDPFPFDKKGFAIVGYTTKDRVIEKLGNPSTSRLGERMFIYAGGQRDKVWVGGVLLLFYGGGFLGGAMPTYKTHLVIFEFDVNDVVTAVHQFYGDEGEIESGLYIVNSGGYSVFANKWDTKFEKGLIDGVGVEANRDWYFSAKSLIIRATKNMGKQAKQFVVPPNKSVIYYYKKYSNNVEASLDNNLSVDPGSDGFLMWVVDPGEHTIKCPYAQNIKGLTMHCYDGERYYLEHKTEMIRVEDKSIGEEEISKRSLVIDRLTTFDFDLSEYHNEFDSF